MTDLACSASTLRPADLVTRLRAAGEAGFTAVGLRLDDYRGSGRPDAEVRDLLDEHGLRVLEMEHNWDWAGGPVPEEQELFQLADGIGVRQLNVPMFAEHDQIDLVAGFGGLCDRAADHGVLVGLEFMPYSAVRDLGRAWEVVAAADRPNGGVVLDLWHWFRSGGQLADLALVPAERIVSVQLGDVLAEPFADLRQEARHHRRLPGRGAGETTALLVALRDRGVKSPVSVEVFSDDLDAMPASAAAAAAFVTGRDALLAAGWPDSAPWHTSRKRTPTGH
jgi:sugar phosphate isomerase/epimerase